MTLTTAHILLIAFGFGLLIGCLVSYFIIRNTLHKNMRSLARAVRVLHDRRDEKEREDHSRKESLVILADKLKRLETNLKQVRVKEYKKHISELNKLLNDAGIAEINK
ncbi:hypothetical protein ACFL67_04305 [candidate division KSB1 bacterium]